MSKLKLNLGGILLGDNIEYRENVNIELDEEYKIVHIGNGYDAMAKDYKQFILLPPLVNSHTHIADFTFPEIGIDKTIKELVGDPYSEKYRFLKIYSDILDNGIREFIIKSANFGVFSFLDFREEGVQGVMKAKRSVNNFLNIKYLSLGRLDKFDEDELRKLSEIADGYGLPDYRYHTLEEIAIIRKFFSNKIRAVHFAETKKQYLRDSLEDLISIYSPSIIIHGTHFTARDFQLLNEKQIALVFCPRSNMWFGVGIPRISSAYDNNVKVLFGTDNGSWISPNLWKDLELAMLITRVEKPGSNYSKNILLSATIEAYKILGVDYSIKEGNITFPILIKGDEILRAHDKYTAMIKRASDNGIYSLGAIQNIS